MTLERVLDGARALLLDVDDTIVDTRGAMVAAGARAAAALWPDRPGEHHAMAQRYYDDPERWFPRYASGKLPFDRPGEHHAMAQRYYDDPERWFPRYASGEVPFDRMRAGRLLEVAAAFGLGLPDDAHAAFEEAYAPAFRSAQRLFPDVPQLLSAAEREGLPVGLLTNSAHAPTVVKLEALGLVDRFEVVVTTDTLGFGKPDPRVYLEACRLLGGEPHAVVCIGDSLAWDVLGAEAAGLRAVWLDREGRGAAEEVASVRDLHEVTAALVGRFGSPPSHR